MPKVTCCAFLLLVLCSLDARVGIGYSLDVSASKNDQLLYTNYNVNSSNHICATWHYFSPAEEKCKCYKSENIGFVKCSDNQSQHVMLELGQCMTQEEDSKEIFVAICPYFQLYGHNISEPGFINLPDNISELNDYMCGPMNRKGHLCSECINGFGPSFTSIGYQCSNCTDVWYGIPLYILTELVPVTVFYLIILVFQIELASSPMTCFLFYSQLIVYTLLIDRNRPINQIFVQLQQFETVVLTLYGMWNLDFVRYTIPPFCISSKLHTTHIMLLGYVSAFFPLALIFMTWLCVELHGRNFRPLVWLWRPFHRFIVKLRRGWDTRSDIIDVFTAFLLLSYSKLMYQFILFVNCPRLVKAESGKLHMENAAGTDLTTTCRTANYFLLSIPACLVICLSSLPVLLLTLYPVKPFRICLSKWKLDLTAVNIFVEKFHSCYRDGLDGGRDMRSFSGLYFFLRVIVCLYCFTLKYLSMWSFEALLFAATAVLIAFIKPYKKVYMNVIDALLLLVLAVLSVLLSSGYSSNRGTEVFIVSLTPALGFWLYVVLKVIFKAWKLAKSNCEKVKPCSEEQNQPCQPLMQPPSFTEVGLLSYGIA